MTPRLRLAALLLLFAPAASRAGDPLATRLDALGEGWDDAPRVARALGELSPEAAAEVRGWVEAGKVAPGTAPKLGEVLNAARNDDLVAWQHTCTNVDTFRTAEHAWFAAYDEYVPLPPVPVAPDALGMVPLAVDSNPALEKLGWIPEGPTRASFAVVVGPDAQGRPDFTVTGAVRLWSGRVLRCVAARDRDTGPDEASEAFIAGPDGRALVTAAQAGWSPGRKDEPLGVDLDATLDLIDTLPLDHPEDRESLSLEPKMRWMAAPTLLGGVTNRTLGDRCFVRFDAFGSSTWVKAEHACGSPCDATTLAAQADPRWWVTRGDRKKAAVLEAACAGSLALDWLPKADRRAMRPADFVALLTLLEPLVPVAEAEPAREARLRAAATAMAANASAARDDGLAVMLGGLHVQTDHAPADPLLVVRLRFADLAALFGVKAQGWDPTRKADVEAVDLEAEALALVREGGPCVAPGEGPAVAAELARLPDAEATRWLLRRCDARGPDPLYGGPFHPVIQVIGRAKGTWTEPEVARAWTWWDRYWVTRAAAEPLLLELDRIGTLHARAVAARWRTELVQLVPSRRLAPHVEAALGRLGQTEAEHHLGTLVLEVLVLHRLGRIGPVPDELPGNIWDLPAMEARIVSLDGAVAASCSAATPGSGCASRAWIAAHVPPIYARLGEEPDGAEAAARLRAALTAAGVP